MEALTTKGCINSGRITRWMERIQLYDFKINYRKPEELQYADALSRSFNEVNLVKESELDKLIFNTHVDVVHRGS